MNPYPVKTDLPASKSPLAWATVGNGMLFTAQIPIDAEGKVVDGGIEPQIIQTLANLKHTLDSAGSRVSEPYPNRAAIIVSGFAREEMLVEILAYAVVP